MLLAIAVPQDAVPPPLREAAPRQGATLSPAPEPGARVAAAPPDGGRTAS
jgi:hypothetical protein